MAVSDVKITVNKNASREIKEAIKNGLRKVGMIAETHAKEMAPVDTGLLRNSITFALGGENPNITEYADDKNNIKGSYAGAAPADANGDTTLYVGTNVHYAPYQELGHHTASGGWIDPQPFLRPAMENHSEEYHRILIDELNKVK